MGVWASADAFRRSLRRDSRSSSSAPKHKLASHGSHALSPVGTGTLAVLVILEAHLASVASGPSDGKPLPHMGISTPMARPCRFAGNRQAFC